MTTHDREAHLRLVVRELRAAAEVGGWTPNAETERLWLGVARALMDSGKLVLVVALDEDAPGRLREIASGLEAKRPS